MPHKVARNPADFIVPLNINRLEGRMMHLPAPKTKKAGQREILFVYGLHSSLERWWGLAQALNHYGAVTVPDMPGFGGMDSFYKLRRKPTLDAQADYLAAFIKLRYKRKKVMIVGLSFGFIVATRMLQRYPELTKKVTVLISLVGFAHKDDFTFSKPRFHAYLLSSRIISRRIPSMLFRGILLHPLVLKNFYGRTHNAKKKFAMAEDKKTLDEIKEVEVGLWRNNDARTWAFSTIQMFTLDNCKVKIDLPAWHVAANNDHYFDNQIVEQHMRIIFKDLNVATFDMAAHAPSVLATEEEAAALIPPKLKRYLSRMK